MDTIPISILVIENHPIMREALLNAIAAEPDLTVSAPVISGAEASQMVIAIKPDTILLGYKPDIILLALENSGLDSLSTLRTLRECLPEIPILALTSNEVAEEEQAALEAGAQVVLTKASPRSKLIEKLRELGFRKSSENIKVALQEEVLIEI